MGRILSAAKPYKVGDAMIRRIAIAALTLVFIGLLGFALLSWRAAIKPPLSARTRQASPQSLSPKEKFSPRRDTVCLATSGRADNHLLAGMA